MSVKPSRSEIETALSGNNRRTSSGKRRIDSIERQLDSMPARRQQVIGGDLTGVSKRQHLRGRFGWLADINYVNWTASAIVLMIVAVFFWPEVKDNVIQEVGDKGIKTQTGTYYDEARVDRPASEEKQSFTRPSDVDRASEFRVLDEQEQSIRQLLSKAEAHIAKGEYTTPTIGNAVASYKKVLSIQSNNNKARQGLEYVRGRYLNLGYQALEQNSLSKAKLALEKLATIEAGSPEYTELSEAVSNWQTKREVDKFIVSANRAFNAGKLILPARQNALFYYQQILELDAENQVAQGGINRIVSNFVNKTNSAISEGQLEAASGYLTTISVIDAKHASIAELEQRIARATTADSKESTTTASAITQTPATQAPAINNPIALQPDDTPTVAPSANTPSTATPKLEAREQETFDRQYLQRGLNAYYKGEYDTAVALLQPLADKGVSRAQFRIAYMHHLGRGFPKDSIEADRIIRAALPAIQKFANEGRGWAQSDIGSLYEDGLVLPRDYGEAIYWYRSAAEQGYAGAQTNLGIMYARGLGVSTSRKTAIEWFQRAAKQGDIAARRNLETMGIN